MNKGVNVMNIKKIALEIYYRARNVKNYFFCGNSFKKKGKNNRIIKDFSSNFRHTKVVFQGNNNTIRFGKNCSISGVNFLLEGDNNQIYIGDKVGVSATKRQPTVINAFGGRKIQIGNGCLLSNSIEIHTSDYHGIYDRNTGERVNCDKDVIIGEHVWIGLRTIILKGTCIANGCVIGAGSVLTGNYAEENAIIVGNKGRVINENVVWSENAIENMELMKGTGNVYEKYL